MMAIESKICDLYASMSFLKVKCDYFDIGKVLFTFVKTDKDGKATNDAIDCCLSFAEASEFCMSILQGRIVRPTGNMDAWNSGIGGVHEEDARQRGLRKDGLAVARWFAIQSANAGWARFTAFQTGGKTAPNGLIVPEKNCARTAITVPIPTEQKLRQMACEILMALNAYQTARYMTGWDAFMQDLTEKRQKPRVKAVSTQPLTAATEKKAESPAGRKNLDCYYAEEKGSFYEIRGEKANAHVFRMVVPLVSEDEPGILETDHGWQLADVIIYDKYLEKDSDRSGELQTAIEKAANGVPKFRLENLPLIVGDIRDGYRQLIYRR